MFNNNNWNPNNILLKTQWPHLSFRFLFLQELPLKEFVLHFTLLQELLIFKGFIWTIIHPFALIP